MNRTNRLLLLFLMLFSALSLSAQAKIKFEKTTHDFGKFAERNLQQYDFVFTNTGDEPLVIHQVFASCGCTATQFTKDPVKPGKTGVVTVTYSGRGRFPGRFRKPVTVRSNAEVKTVRLYIEGVMLPDAQQEKK